MKTTRVITDVKLIDRNVKRAIVVLSLDGHADVVRTTDQMLIDFQNSLLIRDVRSTEDPRFVKALRSLKGAKLTGDLQPRKAGESYTIDATHPDVVAGKAKAGEKRIAEKDGVWVEGFLSIEESLQTQMVNAEAEAWAEKRAQILNLSNMFGSFNATTAAAPVEPENVYVPSEEVPSEEQEILDEVLGNGKPA